MMKIDQVSILTSINVIAKTVFLHSMVYTNAAVYKTTHIQKIHLVSDLIDINNITD
jgi:hypothetical protein